MFKLELKTEGVTDTSFRVKKKQISKIHAAGNLVRNVNVTIKLHSRTSQQT